MSAKRWITCLDCGEYRQLCARTLCSSCYQRRWGRDEEMPPKLNRPTFDELFAQASEGRSDSECWPWPGAISSSNGYPTRAAYRTVWVRFNGPIPRREGKALNVDHQCHSESDCRLGSRCPHRRCVNPAHLRLLTWEENVALRKPQAMCARGLHPDIPRDERSQKGCPDCYRDCKAAYRAAHRAELAAAERVRRAAKKVSA